MEVQHNKLLPSYHGGHSECDCDHPTERSTTEDIVRAYLKNGVSRFAITPHTPTPTEALLYEDERDKGRTVDFLAARFDNCFREIRPRVLQIVGNQAHVAFGFETEYYGENPVGRTRALVERYSPDLIVLSVHHVKDIPIDFNSKRYDDAVKACGGLDNLYLEYYNQQYDFMCGVSTFIGTRPVIIGHFDLIKKYASQVLPADQKFDYPDFSPALRDAIERNIKTAISFGHVFEVNARAFSKNLGEPYPSEAILALIQKFGGDITLGDDSHGPEQVGNFYELSLPFVRRYFKSIVAYDRLPTGDLKKVTINL